MPLIMDGVGTPSFYAAKKSLDRASSTRSCGTRAEFINLALINNMPDAALEDTETQFFRLLEAASGDIPVYIKLYSLPGIARSNRAEQHLRKYYQDFEDLWDSDFDGVIMTGTEPRHSDLRAEPYWKLLTSVLDWAEGHTVSTVLSCLAAHAGVLYSDAIPRHALADKQSGVFEFRRACDHAITRSISETIHIPHSRWNEVRETDLLANGYTVLTKSSTAGVDLFAKKKKKSLFIYFQGHPEYETCTLLKEYRRDIKRFLRGEQETYPAMPAGYFDATGVEILNDFREMARSDRQEAVFSAFPEAAVTGSLQKTWQSASVCVYRSWLQYVSSRAWLRSATARLCVLDDGAKREALA